MSHRNPSTGRDRGRSRGVHRPPVDCTQPLADPAAEHRVQHALAIGRVNDAQALVEQRVAVLERYNALAESARRDLQLAIDALIAARQAEAEIDAAAP